MDPNRIFYIRELAKETQTPYGMVYKELENLEKLGIITREKKGNLTLLHVNTELPYLLDLRQVILKTTGILYTIRDKLNQLDGIRYLLVFGSAARGKETHESDLDLMIIGEVDEELLVDAIRDLEDEAGKAVNYILWSVDEFEKKIKEKNHILLDVAENPITMLRGSEDEFRQFIERGNHQTG
jgi:predicted nucleotidyltransferase